MDQNNLIDLPSWNRAVIKVGSAIIAPDNQSCGTKYLLHIANFVNQCRRKGKEIIIVSSGAVAAGQALQTKYPVNAPKSIPVKQALAAIGQPGMFSQWKKLFDFPCAQLLITLEDLLNRERYVNVKNTLNEVLRMEALPIVNENDTVGVHELKVGDNDNLSAHVADLVDADLLLISTDTDGLYTDDPAENEEAEMIPEVKKIDKEIYNMAGSSSNPVAKGGMKTKIEAAEKAVQRGINTIILNGQKYKTFENMLNGKVAGTLFHKEKDPRTAKKNWMLHALRSEGEVIIDKGAANALIEKSASLLPAGVKKVKGEFNKGSAVKIYKLENGKKQLIGKGTTQYDSEGMRKIKGKQSFEIKETLGYITSDAIVQRDDMVVLENITHKEDIK